MSPGLAIRTATLMLQETQTVTPATVIGGGAAPLQLQCQFHTITVVPGGVAGTSALQRPDRSSTSSSI